MSSPSTHRRTYTAPASQDTPAHTGVRRGTCTRAHGAAAPAGAAARCPQPHAPAAEARAQRERASCGRSVVGPLWTLLCREILYCRAHNTVCRDGIRNLHYPLPQSGPFVLKPSRDTRVYDDIPCLPYVNSTKFATKINAISRENVPLAGEAR